MKKDEKAQVQELKTEQINKWMRIVQDEASFGDKLWRAAIGKHVLPIEPKKNKKEIVAECQKWGTEEEMDKLGFLIMMFVNLLKEGEK